MARREMSRRRALITHVFLIALGVTMVLPFLWMVTTSLKSENEVFQRHVIPRATTLGEDGTVLKTRAGQTLYHASIKQNEYGQNMTRPVLGEDGQPLRDKDGEIIEEFVYQRGEPVQVRVGNPKLHGGKGDVAETKEGASLSDDEGLPVHIRDIGWGGPFTRFRDPRKYDKWKEPVLVPPDFFGDERDAANREAALQYFQRYAGNWEAMVAQRWNGLVPLMLTAQMRDAWDDKAGKAEPLVVAGTPVQNPNLGAGTVGYYQYKDLTWATDLEQPSPVRNARMAAKVVTDAGLPIRFEAPFPVYKSADDPLMVNAKTELMAYVGDAPGPRRVLGREVETDQHLRLMWSNYRSVLMDPDIKMSLYAWNSLFISVCVVLLQLTTSSLAAFAFARLEWPGRDKVFFAYLATLMIPGIVVSIPNFLILQKIGWLDSFAALIVPTAATAYGTFMLRQYMLTLPRGLEEAALIDGASLLRVWWDIVVPLCKPALITLAIFTFAATWQSFTWPLIVTTSEDVRVLPVALKNFSDNQETVYNLLMAASLIMMIPMLLLFIFGQKYFVRGIQLGGVKG